MQCDFRFDLFFLVLVLF